MTSIIKGENIIWFGPAPWYAVPSVPEHTITILSRENRVLYIEPLTSWVKYLFRGLTRPADFRIHYGVRQISANLFIYTPPPLGLPLFHKLAVSHRLNQKIIRHLVNNLRKRLDFATPLLWLDQFHYYGLIGHFSEKLSIYECRDLEVAVNATPAARRLTLERENELCRRVSLIFAISPELQSNVQTLNPHTHTVLAAANFDHFHQATDEGFKIPEDMVRFQRPILGYIGQLDPWKIDLALIAYLAERYPDWSLVFVGYVHPELKRDYLRNYQNVHILGGQPYEALPAYLKGFDVCLMPFLINEATRHGDHLKLYEYLAAGKPVVSTAVPSAQRFASIVKVSRSYEEFGKNVEGALQSNNSELIRKRIAIARENCWEARVAQKSQIIRRHLGLP